MAVQDRTRQSTGTARHRPEPHTPERDAAKPPTPTEEPHSTTVGPGGSFTPSAVLRLQRVVGNRAVSGMLGGGTIQRVPYAVAYSEIKTKGILNASEGRASPSNGAIGHPRQHVGRWEKAEHFAEEQGKTKSVYSSTQEQDKAIASGLSSVAGQAVLAQLDAAPAVATRRTIPNVATDAVDVKVVKAKKKAGTGTVKSWDYKSGTATVATIAVDSMGTGTTGDIHIQTAYPVLD